MAEQMEVAMVMVMVRKDYEKIDLSRGAAIDIEVAQQGEKMHIPSGIPRIVALSNHQGTWAWVINSSSDLKQIWGEYISKLPIIIGANIKYDLSYFATAVGIDEVCFVGDQPRRVWDVLAVDRFLFAGGYQSFSLKSVAERWIGVSLNKDIRDQFSLPLFSTSTSEEQVKYCAEDAHATYWVAVHQKRAIRQYSRLLKILEEVVLPSLMTTLQAQLVGVTVDVKGWLGRVGMEESRMKDIGLTIMNKWEIKNPSSVQEVSAKFRQLGVQLESTGEEELEKIKKGKNKEAADLAEAILQWRESSKICTTYGARFILEHVRDGKVKSAFEVAKAITGRIISSEPNLQQIPRGEFRRFIIPSPGYKFVIFDFSAQEPRIGAQISRDTSFIDAVNSKDIYIQVAKTALGWEIDKGSPQRQLVKTALLGMMYGMGPKSLAERVQVSLETAKMVISSIDREFHRFQEYRQRVSKLPIVFTILGRPIWIPMPDDERSRINAPIQGSGSDMLMLTMSKLTPVVRRLGARFVLFVHDEIVCEVPEEHAEELAKSIEEIVLDVAKKFHPEVRPKIEIFVGDSWGAKE